ncbi:MAG: glycogen debranching enzyme, partial [Spirochaetales bacterium]|nr:glycogen debranching enzyme [Spirochaetales bacterium]
MRTDEGKPLPLGASISERGIQFAVFSRNAAEVSLLFFDKPEDAEPAEEVFFNPEKNRSGDIWHILLPDVKPGALYLYRVDGPYNP